MLGGLKGWFVGLSQAGKAGVIIASVTGLGVVGAATAPPNCSTATTYSNKIETVTVPFDTVDTKDPKMLVSETKVTKPGVDGSKKVTYKVGTCNGKQVSKKSIKEVILSDSVSEQDRVGSKEITTTTEEVSIPFSAQSVGDSTMDKGTTKVVQNGVNGTKEVTYQIVTIDGRVTSKTVKSQKVTLQPVTQITHYGTYVAYQPTCANGSYTNVDGYTVCNPSSSPTGATAKCVDGTYSYSLNHSGTCSHHGGVAIWY